MQTLYIDIYFLINFTVDLIGLHLASEFSKIHIKSLRLILFSFLISIIAVVEVFVSHIPLATIIVNLLSAFLVFLLPYRIGKARRFRFLIVSYVFLMLIGGLVFAIYNYMKEIFPEEAISDSVNRRILMLAFIILIAVGAVKIFVSLLKDVKNEKSVRVTLFVNGRSISIDSFVDTGNFLKDPIDGTPVMLIKKGKAASLFPFGIPTDMNDSVIHKYKNVRLLPINVGGESKIMLGYRPKRAIVAQNGSFREITTVFAVDEEEGSYGGYDALVPPSVIE